LQQLDRGHGRAARGALHCDEVVDAVEGGCEGIGHGCQVAPRPRDLTFVPALLSLAPWKNLLEIVEFGTVWDGQPAEQIRVLVEDERIAFLLDEPDGERFVAAAVQQPFEIDLIDLLDAEELWGEPRFVVPTLGPEQLGLGEILLLVQARYAPDEPTNDALHFQAAIEAQDENPQLAVSMFKLAIEAGDLKGHYGAGYALLKLGLARQAAEHLGIYTRLTPFNAWAWCWLGKAQAELGETAAARASYQRALEAEAAGGFETDAAELLERLG
jgi:tetratricopeptide (TPR) repeat protein